MNPTDLCRSPDLELILISDSATPNRCPESVGSEVV